MNIEGLSSGTGFDFHSYSERTSGVFAQDIMRRAADPVKTEESASIASGDMQSSDEQARQRSEKRASLEQALAGTIDFVSEKFGGKAATAVMGIIYKRIGEGNVTEEKLGEGLVDAARFIDRQFGVQSGDEFISQLNGSLNEGLNAFFENGKNEKFLVSTPATGMELAAGVSVPEMGNGVETGNGFETLKDLLESVQENMKKEEADDPYARQEADASQLENGMIVDERV